MEKASSSSQELQCVGRLEIVRPKPVGFLCGSIPVPTDKSFNTFNSALVPSTQTVRGAPRYQMIPTATDLNMPPLFPKLPDKVFPVTAPHFRTGGDLPFEGDAITSNLSRKGEALAVRGLVEHGDELDVIAPADIMKQIFKMPYSKARLSIAVHRIGQTLILNTGPDVEEGEELVRRHNKNQSKGAEKSLFLNFAMHSVRMEACDCPTAHHAPSSNDQPKSSALPGKFESKEGSLESPDHPVQEYASKVYEPHDDDDGLGERFNGPDYPKVKQDRSFWGSKKSKRNRYHDNTKKVSQVKEKPRSSMQDSDKYRRVSNDGFLRLLFWKFHNFRMLLGSDLLIFSNEKYVAVSLHLWDVSRQVTPLTWLEAWLDNVMASVPELAICYHRDGVVQGYELLKTNEIFLSKGVSENGTPAFNPHIVQHNGHSVLRFLQENCKQDPGAYWLYKSAGEDVIQLFDLSVIPKSHSSDDCTDSSDSLPSLVHRGRSDSLLSLGTLLYRIAHRLSLSMSPNNRARCASFFKKCLDFLDEPEHLIVRAIAHEQFARLLLNSDDDELNLASEESSKLYPDDDEHTKDTKALTECGEADPTIESEVEQSVSDENFAVCEVPATLSSAPTPVVQTVIDPISSKLAAIHHVSQAIKSLRYKRELHNTESELEADSRIQDDDSTQPLSINFSVCACGDSDCIEVCDIREWLPTSKLDDKLWKLVLLLGESYLALGQAFKDSNQLHQTLKVVELACLVYGSMPQHLKDARFISSMTNASANTQVNVEDNFPFEDISSTYLFWAKAWTLVGDIYVEFHVVNDKNDLSYQSDKNPSKDLEMSSEVLKELERLKKKLGEFNQNCSLCSLVNCSCQSDRASSGSSASSSGSTRSLNYSRKQSKKSNAKNVGKQSDENRSDRLVGSDKHPPTEDKKREGGIFRYVRGSISGDADSTLSAASNCYEEARKALGGLATSWSSELQSVVKKKGWVCNELGRIRLGRKDLKRAEQAFIEAVNAFKQISDHTNSILIYCNLGHGRRAVAEETVAKIESLKKHGVLGNAYAQALEAAKLEYGEALKYYGAAKTELTSYNDKSESVSVSLKNEVYTQFAHTYLRLGMLLARENESTDISANEAIKEAISVYEDLGKLRKQEAAFAYFQLACYQRDCCLRFIELDQKKKSTSNGQKSGVVQRVKQYASLAERSWQKSMDFYKADTHSVMYLTILVERSALLSALANSFHSNAMMESALSLLLEGRRVTEKVPNLLEKDNSNNYGRFWRELQNLLKNMLAAANISSLNSQQQSPPSNLAKLKKMYRISLKSTPDCALLRELHTLWIS
jgi:hypothetical protein